MHECGTFCVYTSKDTLNFKGKNLPFTYLAIISINNPSMNAVTFHYACLRLFQVLWEGNSNKNGAKS
jgi:hypothetical protein